MSRPTPARRNGRPEFVSLIAAYQFITAAILLLLSCLIPTVLFPAIFVYVSATGGIFIGLFLATIALTLLLGFGFASVVVGWGLLRMREWARLGAIVLSAFALIGFPIWTIVSILILIYLTSEEARGAFKSQRDSRRSGQPTPEAPQQAVYKAEPPTSAAEETRRMTYTAPTYTASPGTSNGGPEETLSGDETGSVAMPVDDPAWATESFYDQEADVSDHYRRWKQSLPQEPGTGEEPPPEDPDATEPQQPNTEEAIPMPGPSDEPAARDEESQTDRPAESTETDEDDEDEPDDRNRGV